MDTSEYIECLNLTKEAKNTSIKCLKNFFRLLDLNPNCFKHIYNITTKFEKNNSPAQYIPEKNHIILDIDYITNILHQINEHPTDEKTKNNLLLNLSANIIHEMIHANRAIIIANELNSFNTHKTINAEIINYNQNNEGYNTEEYERLLEEKLNDPTTNEYKNLIPIKIIIKDNNYKIIVYNKETKNYYMYDTPFKMNINQNTLHDIGIELNKKKYPRSKIIYTTNSEEKDARTQLPCDYYINNSNDKRIINPEEEITTDEYIIRINKELKKIAKKINNANGFEEVITETITNIIIYSQNKRKLDLESITNKIINSDNFSNDEKLGAFFVNQTGVDLLRWFMTSSYEDVYNNYVENIYKSNYDSLIEQFNNMYNTCKEENIPSQYSIKKLKRTIKNRL